MKLISLFSITVLGVRSLFAQPVPDSVQVARANWRSTRLDRHLVWKEVHFDSLFKAKQNINIIVLKNRRKQPTIALASAGDSLKPTSWFGRKFGARVAMNGTFFDTKQGGSVDLIKIDGQILDTTRISRGTLAEHQQSAVAIHKNRINILFGGNKPGWDRRLPDEHVMTTGPLLLRNGKAHLLQKNAFNDNRHPRTCLCLGPRNQLVFITVDGRHANAQGMSLHELTNLTRWLGCRDAINFDGGGSTTLWIRPEDQSEQSSNGVVNYPSDSKQWIHTGERPVSNVILIR